MTALQMRILELCAKASKEQPVTRQQLRMATGMGDRTIRREIEALRRRGCKILSTSHTSGYWLSDCEVEYRAFRTEYKARAMRMLTLLYDMDTIEGQIELSSSLGG